jgi:hypothetical protein
LQLKKERKRRIYKEHLRRGEREILSRELVVKKSSNSKNDDDEDEVNEESVSFSNLPFNKFNK